MLVLYEDRTRDKSRILVLAWLPVHLSVICAVKIKFVDTDITDIQETNKGYLRLRLGLYLKKLGLETPYVKHDAKYIFLSSIV